MVQPNRYFATGAARDAEREQLRLLAAAYNGASQRRLESLGIGRGWHCLEVGAGGGHMARWMAAKVAPDGFVVALDRGMALVGIVAHARTVNALTAARLSARCR